jgi:hypothetical protein
MEWIKTLAALLIIAVVFWIVIKAGSELPLA